MNNALKSSFYGGSQGTFHGNAVYLLAALFLFLLGPNEHSLD